MKLRDGDVWLAQSAGVNLRFLSPSHGPCRAIFRISPDPSRESRTDGVLLLQDAPGECPPGLPPLVSMCSLLQFRDAEASMACVGVGDEVEL